MPFPFGHNVVLSLTDEQLKKFCPNCKQMRSWRYEDGFKICKKCGLRVKLSKVKP